MTFLKSLPLLACLIVGTPLMAGHEPAPDTVTGTKKIEHVQAKSFHDAGVLFLDVRGESAFNESHIAGAEHLDVKGSEFTSETFKTLLGDTAEKVVIYCNGEKCSRSATASEKAVVWGYTNVYYFRGGFPDWNNNDYPTE